MKNKFSAVFVIFTFMFFLAPAGAQVADSFSFTSFDHKLSGVDRIIEIGLRNHTDKDVRANGRLVVLNVYDTSPPMSLPINNIILPAGSETKVKLIWSNAPFLGQIRTLLVLNDGGGYTNVGSFDFWLFPWQGLLILFGGLMVTIGITLGLSKITKRKVTEDKMPFLKKGKHLEVEKLKKEEKRGEKVKKKKEKEDEFLKRKRSEEERKREEEKEEQKEKQSREDHKKVEAEKKKKERLKSEAQKKKEAEKQKKLEEKKKQAAEKKRKKPPANMVFYTVEFEDTVVSIANRFGEKWEDIVKANKLKPPYELEHGKDILVPKHDLNRPEDK